MSCPRTVTEEGAAQARVSFDAGNVGWLFPLGLGFPRVRWRGSARWPCVRSLFICDALVFIKTI